MDIQKIDRNFAEKRAETEGAIEYFTLPDPRFALYGVFYDTTHAKFLRLPYDVAEATSEGVLFLNGNTAGGRLRFSTDSNYLSLDIVYPCLTDMPHMPLTGSSGFVLLDETDKTVFVHAFRPEHTDKKGFSSSVSLGSKGIRDYILYFPLYNDVSSLTIGLEKGCRIGRGKAYRDIPPVLYYGSSIMQGGCASRPDNSYQALISKWTNTDYINLGFSGNAKAEKAIADYLPTVDCSVFVCDYDHNAPTAEYLADTHLPLYKAYRAVRKDTPVLLIGRPSPERDAQGALRMKIIRETYEYALRNGDKNIYLLDGKTLFGQKDRENCTVDGCHPNDVGFRKMAYAILRKLKQTNLF